MGRKPTYEELEQKNKELEKEADSCRQTEEALQKAYDELEQRVADRTSELMLANEQLRQEIEDRKHVERALRESEERYSLATGAARVGVWDWNMQTGEFYLDPNIKATLGYSDEEIPNDIEIWSSYVHPDDKGPVMEAFQEHVEGKTPQYVYEHRMRHKDGSIRWILVRGTAVRDDRGNVVRVVGTDTDITIRKRTEEALRESEEKYRIVLEANPDPVAVYDMEGRVIYFNPAFTRLFGWTVEECLGKTMDVFVPEEARQETEIMNNQLLAGKRFSEFQTLRYTKKRTTIPVRVSGSIFRNLEGSPAGRVINIRDISIQKKLESQFIHAQKMEAIGTLAGGIAHDFNNLLMGIQGRTSLMLMDLDPSHPFYDHLKGTEEYVKSSADLTKQLLGFARGGKYEVKTTDLNEILKKSSEMFGRTKKQINILTRYQREIWPVDVDQGQIEQVLLNLYVNAWQAMPDGGKLYLESQNIVPDETFVSSCGLKSGKYVKISVTDTGSGMDDETQQRIFDPFFTTKEIGRGTGMGLASAYGIIKNHNGVINVDSRKGAGTTFCIYLPATEKAFLQEEKLTDHVPEGKETILLVDDETLIIEVGEQLLTKMGYKAYTAKSGEEALSIYGANKHQIDIVILDLIMPDMGGAETYERLKETDPKIKVLLSSGYTIDEEARKIFKNGCTGFIQKPFNVNVLAQKLREILDSQ